MIVHFVYNLNIYSGAARQAEFLAKNLPFDYIFLNYSSIEDGKNKVNKTINVPSGWIKQIFAILPLMLRRDTQIFHFHGFFAMGILLAWLFQKKIILKTTMIGGDDLETFSVSIKGKIKLFIAKKCSVNIVLTNTARKINERFLSSSRIFNIPNGVDTTAYNSREKKNYFIFSGLVCKRKRPDVSIRFFHQNFSSLSDAKLFICGPYSAQGLSDEYDEDYSNYCLNLPVELGIQDKVIYTGNLSKKDLFDLLSQAKGFLFFSEREGLSNAVLEAMANNCVPIVSRSSIDYPEILGDDLSQFIIDPVVDSMEISSIDNAILHEYPLRQVVSKYSISSVASKYEKLYLSLLNNKTH